MVAFNDSLNASRQCVKKEFSSEDCVLISKHVAGL